MPTSAADYADIKTRVRRMGRAEVVKLLEQYGFACYDSESTEELEEALIVNVLDGTIGVDAIALF